MITTNCPCGKELEWDVVDCLLDEVLPPYELTCSCCGAEYTLCLNIEILNPGDSHKKYPEDDPEEQEEA